MWPDWDESALASREALGYDTTWPMEEAVAWIEANYVKKIRPRAGSELICLQLPANLRTYWEDCFYCDYLRPDGSADFHRIRRRIAYEEMDWLGEKTGRWVAGNRSLPSLPYTSELVWYEDEDIHDPWIRIEVKVHASLVSRDLLASAMDQAWVTLNHRGGIVAGGQHPLSALIPRAKANRSESKRLALERLHRGEVDFEGQLVEQWQNPDIQEELRGMVAQYQRNAVQLRNLHRAAQKQVYDRVRKWFPDPKPRVAVKGQWRQAMPLPDADAPERGPTRAG